MLIVGAATTFTVLGMYIVWFRVLAFALMIGSVLVVGLVVISLCRRMLARITTDSGDHTIPKL